MRLQTRYRREGFTTASFEARENVRAADGLVDVIFAVKEGPRQVIQEITISGLQSVNEEVVRRTVRLKVGDGLRTDDWLDARRRLFESGLFRRVDIAVEPQQGAADTAPVNLRVTVEEWPALRLRYGFQVSEERPEENVNGRDLVPGVSADLTRRTLFGRAITVGAAAQYENLERRRPGVHEHADVLRTLVQSSLTFERSREEFTHRHARDESHDGGVGAAGTMAEADAVVRPSLRAQPDVRHAAHRSGSFVVRPHGPHRPLHVERHMGHAR